MYFYLKELKKELYQLVESNKDNLNDMKILKMVCIRQDHIINPHTLTSMAKKSSGIEATALNISSNNKQMYSKTSGRYNDDKRNIIYDYCKKEGHSKKSYFKWNTSEYQYRVCSNKGHFEDNYGLLKELIE